jgi:hypothetical protein
MSFRHINMLNVMDAIERLPGGDQLTVTCRGWTVLIGGRNAHDREYIDEVAAGRGLYTTNGRIRISVADARSVNIVFTKTSDQIYDPSTIQEEVIHAVLSAGKMVNSFNWGS